MDINVIIGLLPVLVPIALLQLGLMIAALVHLLKHGTAKVGKVWMWVLLIVLVNIIGPVLYFLLGREDA